ncbi:serine hydrolase domain-containing protein [Sphaerisporangium krabiense]|uniref:CubicO group peptidase (Beta-lactamase class C family) n=1 Tax=Sphaerisporangium krabiense TaxID=763782 RepID=A0A7W9DVJ4_9ACTN|nr:serine hydrolase domain-containing protein [Sphaerisporangium krabiense]MBB5631525.1 CubicO group peptidase (beta-lactamase class C family) [Sphaerisporangium krabiense]
MTMEIDEVGEWLRERLPGLAQEHGVPGVAVAVGAGGRVVEAAAGVLSTATGVEATVDSVFQIGSVTKVLTATLVMGLVAEGLVELDAPVGRYLPGFREATVRQLLCHTAGFEGDVFTDTGKGDDCLERYVDLLADVPQIFAPGEMFSYNNAGYSVLGRIVEVVRGEPFDRCMRDHLFTPLGMTHAANDPYEAILHRAAVGHLGGRPVPVWAMARSNAPAGSMLAMTPRDLLAFARAHLADEGLRAMREPQVVLPDIGWGTAWGLGWTLYDLPGGPVFGHDGNTIGQSAVLRVDPGRDVSVAIFTNGGDRKPLMKEILDRVVESPAEPVPDPAARPDARRCAGVYLSSTSETTVSADQRGRLWLEQIPLGLAAEAGDEPYRTELLGWRGNSLLPAEPGHRPVAFLGDDGEGRARYLHTGRADVRAAGRIEA